MIIILLIFLLTISSVNTAACCISLGMHRKYQGTNACDRVGSVSYVEIIATFVLAMTCSARWAFLPSSEVRIAITLSSNTKSTAAFEPAPQGPSHDRTTSLSTDCLFSPDFELYWFMASSAPHIAADANSFSDPG